MDNRVLIVGGVAFAVGGVAGFLTARKLLEQHYQELSELEINDIKDYYQTKYDDPDKHRTLAERYLKPDLSSLAHQPAEEEEEEEEDWEFVDGDYDEKEEGELTLAEQQLRGVDEPYLIDYEEFVRATDIFDKVDLYWYEVDRTMCDSEDSVYTHPEDILGYEWQELSSSQTIVFVRNERLQTDYEIYTLPQSFGDAVGSRLETDREKKSRQSARTKAAMDAFSSEQLDLDQQLKKKNRYVRPTKQELTEKIAEEMADDELYS